MELSSLVLLSGVIGLLGLALVIKLSTGLQKHTGSIGLHGTQLYSCVLVSLVTHLLQV